MNIEFQNGLIVGLATRGLIKSGRTYEPLVYIDQGQYSYFYIDFKKALQPFSLGMLVESINVYSNNGALNLLFFERVSPSVVRIYCDLPQNQRIVVEGRSDGYLTFVTGEKVPQFFVNFFTGVEIPTFKPAYVYESIKVVDDDFHETILSAARDDLSFVFNPTFAQHAAKDTVNIPDDLGDVDMEAYFNVTFSFDPYGSEMDEGLE